MVRMVAAVTLIVVGVAMLLTGVERGLYGLALIGIVVTGAGIVVFRK